MSFRFIYNFRKLSGLMQTNILIYIGIAWSTYEYMHGIDPTRYAVFLVSF